MSVALRPLGYIAITYKHSLADGQEATRGRHSRQQLEDPAHQRPELRKTDKD